MFIILPHFHKSNQCKALTLRRIATCVHKVNLVRNLRLRFDSMGIDSAYIYVLLYINNYNVSMVL